MGNITSGCKPELKWSDDRIALLKVLWTTDLSAAEIGEELGCFRLYRDGGRCAVLGKAYRLNLPSRIPGYGLRIPRGSRALMPLRAPRPGSGNVTLGLAHGQIGFIKPSPAAFKAPTVYPGTSKTAPSYRNQIGSREMSVGQRRDFLAEAFRNTAAMQVSEAS